MTLKHYLIGAFVQQKDQAEGKKRDLKAKVKQESFQPQEVPLRFNFSKFIAWERQTSVLEMASKKLRNPVDEHPLKVF